MLKMGRRVEKIKNGYSTWKTGRFGKPDCEQYDVFYIALISCE